MISKLKKWKSQEFLKWKWAKSIFQGKKCGIGKTVQGLMAFRNIAQKDLQKRNPKEPKLVEKEKK
jgi:hypothetical protein